MGSVGALSPTAEYAVVAALTLPLISSKIEPPLLLVALHPALDTRPQPAHFVTVHHRHGEEQIQMAEIQAGRSGIMG